MHAVDIGRSSTPWVRPVIRCLSDGDKHNRDKTEGITRVNESTTTKKKKLRDSIWWNVWSVDQYSEWALVA